jgi:hypothetical protein
MITTCLKLNEELNIETKERVLELFHQDKKALIVGEMVNQFTERSDPEKIAEICLRPLILEAE